MIYTTGYTGQNFEALTPLLDRLDAALIDARLSPHSRVPAWQGSSLARVCGAKRYFHLAEFGNVNYQSNDEGQIKIADFGRGYEKLLDVLAQYPSVLIICACKRFDRCHRRVLSGLLAREKFPTVEITDWVNYPTLF